MSKLQEYKYRNQVVSVILLLELLFLVYFAAGMQFNIFSITISVAILLLFAEAIIISLLPQYRLLAFYISIILNIVTVSFYALFYAWEIFLFIFLMILSIILLIFNSPFLRLLSWISRLIKYINLKIKPEEKWQKNLFNAGLTLSILLMVFVFLIWSNNMNQDYPGNVYKQICFHEAGHAVATERLFPGTVIEIKCNPKVTYEFLNFLGFKNISMGFNSSKNNEKFLTPKTTTYLVRIKLAGELSTKHFFGENHLLGGGTDIPQAYDIARRHFCLSYNDELGTIEKNNQTLLNQKTKQFVDSQATETAKLIDENSQLIKMVASNLEKKGQLSGNELRNIIHTYDQK